MVFVNKSAHQLAAKLASQDPVFDRLAAELAGRVEAEATKHRNTGNLAGSVRVKRGRIDRIVTIEDPAALHIEFGHAQYSKHGPKWVPGLHILSSQVKAMGGS